jgi:DNA-binding transcriptional LysR family regulator
MDGNYMPNLRFDQLRIRHLKFVGLLAKLGSLAATADHLAMTPSAASMMLKEIESIFGVKLFRRQGHGMTLTEQGRTLLPRCQTVLGEMGAMKTSLLGEGRPLLRIGAFPHTTTTVLPAIVKSLTLGTPAWRVQILDGSADQLLELLQGGDIDLLLGRLPSNTVNEDAISGLAQRVLYQSSLSIVASKNHPLSQSTEKQGTEKSRELSLDALLDWPWVLPSLHSTTRVALTNALLKQGLTPPIPVVESPSFFFSLSLVEHTDFLTCCATSVALLNNNRTTILPVKMGLESTPISLIWRKSSAEAQRAIDHLQSEGTI